MEEMRKKCYLWSPYCVPGTILGMLKTAKSCALVVLTKDSALFSLQLVLWPSVCLCLSSLCSGEGSLSSAHLLWHPLYLFWLQCLICVLDKGLSHHLHSPLLHSLCLLEMKLILLYKITVLAEIFGPMVEDLDSTPTKGNQGKPNLASVMRRLN